MILLDTATLTYWLIGFVAIAIAAGALALASAGRLVLANRRTRLARHQSVRTYYRGLVLSH
jgi:hypothetical protein